MPLADDAAAAATAQAAATADATAAAEAATKAAATAADPKAIGDKAVADYLAANVLPEKVELKLPDGVTADAGLLERTIATARASGLSQKQAEAVAAFTVKEQQDREAARAADEKPLEGAAWKAREARWSAEALADKDLGGTPEQFKANIELAKRVIATHGGQEMQDFLDQTGLGSHKAVLRMLVKFGKSMREADFVRAPASAESKKETAQDRMFPTTSKKNKE